LTGACGRGGIVPVFFKDEETAVAQA